MFSKRKPQLDIIFYKSDCKISPFDSLIIALRELTQWIESVENWMEKSSVKVVCLKTIFKSWQVQIKGVFANEMNIL